MPVPRTKYGLFWGSNSGLFLGAKGWPVFGAHIREVGISGCSEVQIGAYSGGHNLVCDRVQIASSFCDPNSGIFWGDKVDRSGALERPVLMAKSRSALRVY